MTTPLILAVEADVRQAACLSGLVRTRLDADLVLVPSVDEALEWLGAQTPDLLLTPLLLSPKDDAALTARLRELHAQGTEVQTLVIPLLRDELRTDGEGDRGGLLNRLRRPRTDAALADGGCSPQTFAAQIEEYLERVVVERHDRDAQRVPDEPVASASAPMLEELLRTPAAGSAPPTEWFSMRLPPTPERPPAEEPCEPDAPPPTTSVAPDELWMPLEIAGRIAMAPIEGHVSTSRRRVAPPGVRRSRVVARPAASAGDTGDASRVDPSFARALERVPAKPASRRVVRPIGRPVQPAARNPAPPQPEPRPARAAAQTEARAVVKPVVRRSQRPAAPQRPPHDEWGVYDPEQCGFSALLARLDAATREESDDQEPPGSL